VGCAPIARSIGCGVSPQCLAGGPAGHIRLPAARFHQLTAGRSSSYGLVACEVKSRLTGSRLVSVPFADHCDPLIGNDADLVDLTTSVQAAVLDRGYRYLELRPLHWPHEAPPGSHAYWFHTIDLTAPLDVIFDRFHKDSIQRKIRRAERERLTIGSRGSRAACKVCSTTCCWRPVADTDWRRNPGSGSAIWRTVLASG
jgi:hypothetical protein